MTALHEITDAQKWVAETLAHGAMERGEPIRAACHPLLCALPDSEIQPLWDKLIEIAKERLPQPAPEPGAAHTSPEDAA